MAVLMMDDEPQLQQIGWGLPPGLIAQCDLTEDKCPDCEGPLYKPRRQEGSEVYCFNCDAELQRVGDQ